MKLSLFIPLFTATFMSVAFAEPLTIQGSASSGNRAPLTGTTATTDLTLDTSTGSFFKGVSGQIAHSITSDGDVNFAYPGNNSLGLTIDVNAASGNVSAISVKSWSQNYMGLLITNSAESSTAKVSINITNALNLTSISTQNEYWTFDNVDAVMTTNGKNTVPTKIGSTGGGSATLNINSNAALTYNGYMSLEESGVLNVNGSFMIYSGTLDFKKNSTTNITGSFEMKMGTYSNLNGTITANTKSAVQFATVNTSTGTFNQVSALGNGVIFNRPVTLDSGANWTVDGKILMQGASVLPSLTTSRLTVNEGSTVVVKTPTAGTIAYPRVILDSHTDLILNKSSAFVDENGKAVGLVTTEASTNNTMHVNANNDFDFISLGADLNVYLSDNITLSFLNANSIRVAISGSKLNIYNFSDGKVFVGTSEQIADIVGETVIAYDEDGNLLDTVKVDDSGWLVLVPEPSSYAAIFGALALSLAAWRRRNRA